RGLGRVGRNALLRGLCRACVEAVRNVPLLLQLLTWYLLLTEFLPAVDAPASLAGLLFLSKAGLAWGAQDGPALSPEYLAVVLGLSVYTAAYVAEIVRAGIAAVPAGQLEAAAALGLPARRTLRLVVLPQALRLILPPLASQYLNLTKNSSLAVAVGYPELVSVANTSLNQSGRAVECIAVIMAVYLLLSLLTAGLMRWAEHRAGGWWAGAR
ncbi:ABC transporter permease subunit, partial [Ramlibacter aquaticus]